MKIKTRLLTMMVAVDVGAVGCTSATAPPTQAGVDTITVVDTVIKTDTVKTSTAVVSATETSGGCGVAYGFGDLQGCLWTIVVSGDVPQNIQVTIGPSSSAPDTQVLVNGVSGVSNVVTGNGQASPVPGGDPLVPVINILTISSDTFTVSTSSAFQMTILDIASGSEVVWSSPANDL